MHTETSKCNAELSQKWSLRERTNRKKRSVKKALFHRHSGNKIVSCIRNLWGDIRELVQGMVKKMFEPFPLISLISVTSVDLTSVPSNATPNFIFSKLSTACWKVSFCFFSKLVSLVYDKQCCASVFVFTVFILLCFWCSFCEDFCISNVKRCKITTQREWLDNHWVLVLKHTVYQVKPFVVQIKESLSHLFTLCKKLISTKLLCT